jgi:hypothetical protein
MTPVEIIAFSAVVIQEVMRIVSDAIKQDPAPEPTELRARLLAILEGRTDAWIDEERQKKDAEYEKP